MVGGLEELVEAKPQGEESEESVLDEVLRVLMALKEERISSDEQASLEALEPVLEQDIDPDSYEHSEYSVRVSGEGASYEYKCVDADENKVEYVAESSQNDAVIQAQDTIEEMKQADSFHSVDLTKFDERKQQSLQALKVEYGQFMTFLMYSGEVRF